MKKLINIFFLTFLAGILTSSGYSQNLNWRSVNEQNPNILYSNFGYDFGVTAQVGYGRFIQTIRPLVLTFDYSMPMGHRLTDDFKVRFGAHVEFFEKNGFVASGKVLGIFRNHKTSLVRISNFGGEFSFVTGYFKPTFHAALELSADGAVVSYLKHSKLMKGNYPEIQDGWYLNNGAHYFYGIQAGKTIGRSYEANLRLGKVNARGNESDVLPIYFQLGLTSRF